MYTGLHCFDISFVHIFVFEQESSRGSFNQNNHQHPVLQQRCGARVSIGEGNWNGTRSLRDLVNRTDGGIGVVLFHFLQRETVLAACKPNTEPEGINLMGHKGSYIRRFCI